MCNKLEPPDGTSELVAVIARPMAASARPSTRLASQPQSAGLRVLKYQASYDYFDKIIVWQTRPLSTAQISDIRRMCRGGCEPFGPAWWEPRYRQRLDLHQPTPDAFELLACLRPDGYVNFVEPTREWIVKDWWEMEEWLHLFQHGFLQPRMRKGEPALYAAHGATATGATTKRTVPNERRTSRRFQWYTDVPSKITHERPCFRFEGKHQGKHSVEAIGIYTTGDLIEFDFDSYFATHIKFYEIDLEHLGRYDRNKQTRGKSKVSRKPQSRIGSSISDRLRGGLIYRAYSCHRHQSARSLQQFVISFRRGSKRPYLRPSPYIMCMGDIGPHLTEALACKD